MTVTTHFSPAEALATLINETYLDAATATIFVISPNFKSSNIATKLLQMNAGGVPVEVIVDSFRSHRGQRHYAGANGLPIWQASPLNRLDQTVILIDATIVLTGAYELVNDGNAVACMNLCVIDDATTRAAYKANYDLIKSTAVRTTSPGW